MSAEECTFALEGINLRGLRWNSGARYKVIALHGWLDNCASFSILAPLLLDFDIVALDLAGHGKSDNRSGVGAYNIWQDLSEIIQVVDQLDWSTFSLLGHSRGAMVASLFAGSFPERINKLCLIDAIVPQYIDEKELPKQLAAATLQLMQAPSRRRSYFSCYESAIRARTEGLFPLSEYASELLAERSVLENEHGFYWQYDRRLLIASEVKFSLAQVEAFIDRFPHPALVFLASNGIILGQGTSDAYWFEEHENLHIRFIEGEHHLQFSDQSDVLDSLVKEIYEYFAY